MARVHLAEDERLGRRVAVKQMHAHSPDEVAVRFEREAKLGASLNHPNLVSIYDIEADAESILIVMEYVDGETLQDAIARGPLTPGRVARIVRDVAAGLDHAHSHGVVHRDVKPANILIRHDGVTKLTDLGIASAAEQTSITRSGVVMGTAAYMAPEQIEGGVAGPRSDVYALAAVAFEALSGEKARTGRTPIEIAHELVRDPAPDLVQRWPAAPAGAGAALERGMARDSADRQQSAGALADELERGLRAPIRRAEVAPRTERTAPTAVHRSSPPKRRRGWLPVAAVGLLVVLAAALGIAALGGGEEGAPSPSGRAAEDRDANRAASEKAGNSAPAADGAADPDVSSSDEDPSPPPEAAPSEETPVSDDPVALNDGGYQLMQAGRYDEAIPPLERAVAAFPEGSSDLTYAYALYNLGRSLRLAGRPDEAVAVLERRLGIPNQTDTVQRELDAARAAAG